MNLHNPLIKSYSLINSKNNSTFKKLNNRKFHIIKETVILNIGETKEFTISFQSGVTGYFKANLVISIFGKQFRHLINLDGYAKSIENVQHE